MWVVIRVSFRFSGLLFIVKMNALCEFGFTLQRALPGRQLKPGARPDEQPLCRAHIDKRFNSYMLFFVFYYDNDLFAN